MDISHFPNEVIIALARAFDFDIERRPTDSLWFKVAPEIELIPIAGEGTGSIYMQLKDRGDILFVDSEGSGGIIAPDLKSLMLLFVCHPYWQDLLKFSGGGSLAEMRRTLPFAQAEYYLNSPEVSQLNAMIRKRLSLPNVADVVDTLHTSVMRSSERLKITAPDGSTFRSLFNTFTVERHTGYRRAKHEGKL